MRPRVRAAAGGACLAVVIAILAGCGGGGHRGAATKVAVTPGPGSSTTSTAVVVTPNLAQPEPSKQAATPPGGPPSVSAAGIAIPAESLVATLGPAGAVGSRTPGGPPTIAIPGSWLGAISVLPVIAQQPGWVEVRLAQRPNGSTVWVPATDLSLATDPYHIVISLATTRLRLFKYGQEVANLPAGVGLPAAPTPAGHFFVALFARAPSPGYGAFVIATSAHSNTITDWEQSGDAITAIHGSLGADGAIGTAGARISHGCIRLHNADLDHLRDVPAGTPIDIVD